MVYIYIYIYYNKNTKLVIAAVSVVMQLVFDNHSVIIKKNLFELVLRQLFEIIQFKIYRIFFVNTDIIK